MIETSAEALYLGVGLGGILGVGLLIYAIFFEGRGKK